MKTFWFINQYGTVPENGYGGRVFYLAKYFAKMGFQVYYIVARNHHLLNRGKSNPRAQIIDGVNVVSIPTFPFTRSRSIIRVLNWFLFNSLLLLVKFRIKDRPHFIFASSPSPLVGVALITLSKRFFSISCFDVRDVWPMTLKALGNVKETSILFKMMAWCESFSMKNADILSSNLPNFSKRISEIPADTGKFLWVPNGYDHDEMLPVQYPGSIYRHLIPKDRFVIGYVGSVGLANALEYFVESAYILRDHDDLMFLIIGEGEKLNELKEFAEKRGMTNILFLPKIKKDQVASVIEMLDVCYLGWRASNLYQYGISPNKIPEYFILGKPVLHSFSGPIDPVALAGAGITVPAEDANAISDSIVSLKNFSRNDLNKMGAMGKRYATANYNYENISRVLLEKIITLEKSKC